LISAIEGALTKTRAIDSPQQNREFADPWRQQQ
jgi:hypothetical protein